MTMYSLNDKILTTPNILSMARIAMLPAIVWLYLFKEEYLWSAGILVISGITDIVDGIIARKFGMISNFGKVLDPIADKLTQITMLLCLVFRFPLMNLLLAVMLIKEVVSGIWGLIVIHRTKEVRSAEWHGKVGTSLLYMMILLHAVWPRIPSIVSNASIVLCTAMMLISFLLYSTRNYRITKGSSKECLTLSEETQDEDQA